MEENAGAVDAFLADVDDVRSALQQFRVLLDAVDDAVYQLDSDGRFQAVNDAFVELSGYSQTELLGEHTTKLLEDDAVERAERTIRAMLASNLETGTLELCFESATGETIPCELEMRLIRTQRGFEGTVGVIQERSSSERRRRGHNHRQANHRQAGERSQYEDRRARSAMLQDLREVRGEITTAIVGQSTREDIEGVVCQHLADSELYQFAWIGGVDTKTQQVTPRASSGPDGYLDEVAIDPADELRNEQTGDAVVTGEIQTHQHADLNSGNELGTKVAEFSGYCSSATIPIVHDDTVFGTVNVYTDRPDAFGDEERRIVGELGEIVGYAVAAVEHKWALMSDTVLEVEFSIRDVFEAYPFAVENWQLTFDRVIPVDNGEFLVYGQTSCGMSSMLDRLAERVPHWDSVAITNETDGEMQFEIHASDAPLVETIATCGGIVESAVVGDGDFTVTVHLPQQTDVRQVVEVVETEYPDVELLARRQVSRSVNPIQRLTLPETLTDRQQTVLATAYHAGYFEWPRDTSGEEVAAKLGISPATFTQHLRTTERKLFEMVFENFSSSK